jgi:hypothetical protein
LALKGAVAIFLQRSYFIEPIAISLHFARQVVVDNVIGRVLLVQNIVLAISLIANCLVTYIVFQPVNAATGSDRMTCRQARSDIENKRAVSAYADSHSASLTKVHEFLRNSDYELRNVSFRDNSVAFVYTSSAFYPSACGIHVPGIDGGIVRIETDIITDPKIRLVW